jgi:hypothetical protein
MEEIFFDLTIPVRPYLKKFVAAYSPIDPFVIKNTKCHFSALFLEPLERVYNKKDKLAVKSRLSDSICIRIPQSVFNQKKYFLSTQSILMIDSRLQALFSQQLSDFIKINHIKGDYIEHTIEKFKNYYSIDEDDLQLRTVTQAFYRSGKTKTPKEKVLTSNKSDASTPKAINQTKLDFEFF